MNIKKYISNIKLWIICFFIILLVLNAVLLSSVSIKFALGDIIYLDLLIIFIYVIFLSIGYLKWKHNFNELYSLLKRKENIDLVSLNKDNFESELIKGVIQYKNNEFEKEIQNVRVTLDEINDYILKWVHEIKIPISVLEIISEKVDDDETSESIKIESDRIRFLAEQALYIGRAADYSHDLEISDVNIEDVIKEVIRKNASFFISKKIELELNNTDFQVMSDKKWMSYILDQIVNNACKYVNVSGKIKIWADEDEKSVKLHIKDNGIGIAKKDIERIFDRGFTGSNGRKAGASTGMGLYFSNKMAEKLNHKIKVYSEANKFTEFIIMFYKISDYFNVT